MSEFFSRDHEECDLHKDVLLFFCDSCSKGCCYKCLYKNHNGHNVFLNSKLVPMLEKACCKADETLTSAKIFEDKLKQQNIELIKQTHSVLKKAQEDTQRCILLMKKEVANMKNEMDKIVVSNKSRFDEFKQTVDKVEELKAASSEALIACMNKEWTKNPEQIVELFKNLDLMMNDNKSFLSKKPTNLAIESFGFSFPNIKYKSHEIVPILGKLEWSKDKDDVEFQNSSHNSFAGKSDSLIKASVISGIENRFGHKIFILSGELNDISSDITINFISRMIDIKGKEVKNDLEDKLQQDKKSDDLIITSGDNSKHIVKCTLPTENIDNMTERDCIKMVVWRALTLPETSARNSKRIVMSACLDNISYGAAGLILETIFSYLAQKEVDKVMTVNIIGKDETVLGILSATVDLLLTDSLKPDQSLTTTFHTGFQLEMHLGSLVEEKCDAILLAVHPSLDLKIGSLSSQILHAAGQEIQQECYAKMPRLFNPGDIVVTRGYNLKCKYVYHTYMGSEADILRGESMKRILINAINANLNCGLSSLALPALGTGVGLNEYTSAALILEEIYRFAMFHSFGAPLKKVVIVLQPSDVNAVEAFFDHMKALNPQLRNPTWTSIFSIDSDSKTQRKKGVTSDEENNPMTDDMKQLSLTDKSERHKPSASSGLRVLEPESSKVIWRYKEKNGNWVDYPGKINVILENNYVNGKTKTKWIENGKTFAVSYPLMTEEIVGSNDVIDIKRVETSKQTLERM